MECRVLLDEATGDHDKLLTDQIKYQRLSQEYKQFVEELLCCRVNNHLCAIDIFLELCYVFGESRRCYISQGCVLGDHWQVGSHFFIIKIENSLVCDSAIHKVGNCSASTAGFVFIGMPFRLNFTRSP